MPFLKFLLISSMALFPAVSSLRAQGTVTSATRNYVFPPVGLGSTETASITLVNTATSSSSGAASPGVIAGTPAAAPSCTGTVWFSNANGAIGTPVSFTLASAAFQTVSLPFASAGLTGNRGAIQAKISLAISTSMPASCSLMFSLEIWDSNTGATHALVTNALTAAASLPIILPGRDR